MLQKGVRKEAQSGCLDFLQAYSKYRALASLNAIQLNLRSQLFANSEMFFFLRTPIWAAGKLLFLTFASMLLSSALAYPFRKV